MTGAAAPVRPRRDEPDDFVIATNTSHSVRQLVHLAFQQVGLDPDDYVRLDPRFLRPAEVDHLIGDYSKARPARLGAADVVRGAGCG